MNPEISGTIRIDDAQYDRPRLARTPLYKTGTYVVTAYYDDGHRAVTVARRDVLEAWGIREATATA